MNQSDGGLDFSPNNKLRRKQVTDEETINKINEEIKLLQYRLTRIVSTGIEHFVDLKVSHVPDINEAGHPDSLVAPQAAGV